MKLIIVTSAFLAIFCCFSQIEFTSAKPTYGYGLPVGSALQGLDAATLLALLGGGASGPLGLGGLLGGGLLGASGPTSQSNTENVAISGLGNQYSSLIDLTGNLNALSGGVL
ncbi:uncharacterized protein LOC129916398 [Episyrphus balteatus]|uniref:uncharacterized protein LOC129916398 n=1 Tax=Episyrphus balteatus TaxID=286459 RepID=UPI0024862F98|nr:uncharacterized protein LOC129916398 [Episyrphus balteatus]